MNVLRNFALATLTIAAIATAALAADTFSLKRTAKLGEEIKFRFNAELAFGDIKIKIRGLNREKVVKVEEDGTITIETVQSEVVISTPDGDSPQSEEAKSTTAYAADRTVKTYTMEGSEDVSSSTRLAIVSTIVTPKEPVAVGATWTADLKANGKGTYPAKGEYKILGEEKVGKWDTVKVQIKVVETEGTEKTECSGTVWLNKADFSTVKEELTIKNAQFEMAPAPIDIVIKNEREG